MMIVLIFPSEGRVISHQKKSSMVTFHNQQNHKEHKSRDSQKFGKQNKLTFQAAAGNIGIPAITSIEQVNPSSISTIQTTLMA